MESTHSKKRATQLLVRFSEWASQDDYSHKLPLTGNHDTDDVDLSLERKSDNTDANHPLLCHARVYVFVDTYNRDVPGS